MGASSLPGFKLDQTFFIHNAAVKKDIHEEIFWLVWNGQGRWDWNTVYNWPIWLRKFYVVELSKILTPKTTTQPKPKQKISKPPF